jgi:hypothetical protein
MPISYRRLTRWTAHCVLPVAVVAIALCAPGCGSPPEGSALRSGGPSGDTGGGVSSSGGGTGLGADGGSSAEDDGGSGSGTSSSSTGSSSSSTTGGTTGGTGGSGDDGGNADDGGSGAFLIAVPATPVPLVPAPGLVGPALLVDLDMSGRSTAEVTELGYTAWPVVSGATLTSTFQGVTFTFAKAGSNGTALDAGWSKTAVDAPNYARLVGDGLTVAGGDAGSQIQLTIHGLAAGKHSLLTYHNYAASTGPASLVDVLVGGVVQVSQLKQSVGVLTDAAAPTSYVTFTAQSGKDVVILYRATGLVMLNGFELDLPNAADQASSPSPADGDEHVNADSGSLTLSWKAGSGAVSHDVYFGNDPAAVQGATHASAQFEGNQAGTTHAVSGLRSIEHYYWRVDEVNAQGQVTRGDTWYFRPRHLAFPTAEGYGRFSLGGRGGVVVHVTNLNDSGAGSLRDAIETDRGPRTVVFDVGGLIPLASRLSVAQNYITVAGQTAPGKGICVRAAPFGVSGAHDILIRDVRVRIGSGPTYDGMGMEGANHSIFDHCSISWSIDEGFSSRNAKNITLQRSFISECLNDANHTNSSGQVNDRHGFAASIGGDIGSFHHNLLAHCEGRNWSLAGGLDPSGYYAGRLDIFNNVVYNWGGRATDGGAHEVDFVSNYYKPGAATRIFYALNAQYDAFPGTQQYYFVGNVMPGYFDESNETKGREATNGMGTVPTTYSPWVNTPFFPSYATTQTAEDAYKDVLSDVGHTEPMFDDHDTRVVHEALTGTYTYKGSLTGLPGLPDSETDVGGFESYPTTSRGATWDTDSDGLPDWWELAAGLNPKSAKGDSSDANIDLVGDGYTELERYLAWMAAPHYFTSVGKSVAIDLAKAFVGYTSSPTYKVASVVNGTVTISGSTATFTAAKCGRASWSVTVTDKAGSTMTENMAAFVDNGSGTCP